MEQPRTVLEQSRNILEQPHMDLEQPHATSEQRWNVLEQSRTILEQPHTVSEQRWNVLKQSRTILEQPHTVSEQRWNVLEQSRTILEQPLTVPAQFADADEIQQLGSSLRRDILGWRDSNRTFPSRDFHSSRRMFHRRIDNEPDLDPDFRFAHRTQSSDTTAEGHSLDCLTPLSWNDTSSVIPENTAWSERFELAHYKEDEGGDTFEDTVSSGSNIISGMLYPIIVIIVHIYLVLYIFNFYVHKCAHI